MMVFQKLLKKFILTALSVMMLSVMVAAADVTTGTVTADALRVRAGAGTDTEIMGLLYEGAVVEITGETGDWYTVAYNDTVGYLHKDYVRIAVVQTSAETEARKADVVNKACEYLGVRYVYGGASPKGFDCSGFTSYVYRQFGYTLPRTASAQLKSGVAVARDELQMGDLVFFRDPSITSKAASHVGIYIGGGQFVHAASSRTGYVKVSSLSENYFSRYYVGARRQIVDVVAEAAQ